MNALVIALGTQGDLALMHAFANRLSTSSHRVTFLSSSFFVESLARQKPHTELSLSAISQRSLAELHQLLAQLGRLHDLDQRSHQFHRQWVASQIAEAAARIVQLAENHDCVVSNFHLPFAERMPSVQRIQIVYDLPESAVAPPQPCDSEPLCLIALDEPLFGGRDVWGGILDCPNFVFTGFWQTPTEIPPTDAALEQFLATGSPPVVVTLGSTAPMALLQVVPRIVEAVAATSDRVLVVGGWLANSDAKQLATTVPYFQQVDYRAVLPRAKCLLHHGGVGTLAAAIQAGCPSVVLPQLGCQYRFGRAMVLHEFASDVLPPKRVTATNLARAIADTRRIKRGTAIQTAARRLSGVHDEDAALQCAVERVQTFVADQQGKLQ